MSGDIPHFDINIKIEAPENEAVKVVCKVKPTWVAADIKFKYFTAGISNFLMGCYLPDTPDDMVLLRVYGQSTELFIDRKAEIQAFKILHSVGCSAPVYCTFANGMAYGYFKGRPLTQKMVVDENIRKLIAQEMAKLHSLGGPAGEGKKVLFYFEKMNIFFNLCPDSFPEAEKQQVCQAKLRSKKYLQDEYSVLRSHLEEMACPVVYSHNDLLLENIIYDESSNKIGFIDFEYCFYNFQAFDIGNHFNEYAGVDPVDYSLYPKEEYQLSWIKTYLEYYKKFTHQSSCEVTDKEVRNMYLNARLCSQASHFMWGIWALIQAKYSKIDFDFLGYAVIRFQEYFRRKDEVFKLISEH